MLIGRRTYEVFAPVWPTYEGEVADRMNAAHKLVVSSTVTDAPWGPASVIGADAADQIRRAKEQPGRDIVQYGFGSVTRLLLEHDLLDELHLWIYPLMIGQPATQDLIAQHSRSAFLEPRDTRTMSNGIVILRYDVLRHL
ncbi:MAG: dihydrofolate reductase family protein [Ilumatobacteraceae bacterium]